MAANYTAVVDIELFGAFPCIVVTTTAANYSAVADNELFGAFPCIVVTTQHRIIRRWPISDYSALFLALFPQHSSELFGSGRYRIIRRFSLHRCDNTAPNYSAVVDIEFSSPS